jgi:hypothetical protein
MSGSAIFGRNMTKRMGIYYSILMMIAINLLQAIISEILVCTVKHVKQNVECV